MDAEKAKEIYQLNNYEELEKHPEKQTNRQKHHIEYLKHIITLHDPNVPTAPISSLNPFIIPVIDNSKPYKETKKYMTRKKKKEIEEKIYKITGKPFDLKDAYGDNLILID